MSPDQPILEQHLAKIALPPCERESVKVSAIWGEIRRSLVRRIASAEKAHIISGSRTITGDLAVLDKCIKSVRVILHASPKTQALTTLTVNIASAREQLDLALMRSPHLETVLPIAGYLKKIFTALELFGKQMGKSDSEDENVSHLKNLRKCTKVLLEFLPYLEPLEDIKARLGHPPQT